MTGGFARSVVNFDAGAETPAAGIYTAIGIALATLFMTPLLANLPPATLAATIIAAVLTLVDFSIIRHLWHYSPIFRPWRQPWLHAFSWHQVGIVMGVGLLLLLHLRTSRPHVAVVSQVPRTEHFEMLNAIR